MAAGISVVAVAEVLFYWLLTLPEGTWPTAGAWIVMAGAVLAAYLVWRQPSSTASFKPKNVAVFGVVVIAALGLVFLLQVLLGSGAQVQEGVRAQQVQAEHRAALILVQALAIPIEEEAVYRGFVYDLLGRWGRLVAIVGSSTAFVLSHAVFLSEDRYLLGVAVWGLVLGTLRYVTRGLTAPVVAHGLGNMLVYL